MSPVILELKTFPSFWNSPPGHIENSKVCRKKYTIDQIPEDIKIGGIIRNNKSIIPDSSNHIMPNDEIIVFVKEESILKAKNIFQ